MILKLLVFLFLGAPSTVFAAAGYSLDPSQSQVTFDGDSTLHGFQGKADVMIADHVYFDSTTATMHVPASVRVPVNQLHTDNKRRDGAMRKMFESERFPEIVWEATSMSCIAVAPSQWNCQQKGRLTIRNLAKDYDLSLHVAEETSDKLQVEGDMEVSLQDFHLQPPSVLGLIKVRDKVRIHLRLLWKPK